MGNNVWYTLINFLPFVIPLVVIGVFVYMVVWAVRKLSARASLCPVCHGTGKYPPAQGNTCHGCEGRGWVKL